MWFCGLPQHGLPQRWKNAKRLPTVDKTSYFELSKLLGRLPEGGYHTSSGTLVD